MRALNLMSASALAAFVTIATIVAHPQASKGARASEPSRVAAGSGAHDFDFHFGTWKTHVRRLQHPLSGSTSWTSYDGTTLVRKVWDGRANLVELEADGPAGHLEALALRLYDPRTEQWSIYYASGGDPAISVPTIGRFANGRGEFYDHEDFNGRRIMARNVWLAFGTDSCRFEQSFSTDEGAHWELNWVATDVRVTRPPASSR